MKNPHTGSVTQLDKLLTSRRDSRKTTNLDYWITMSMVCLVMANYASAVQTVGHHSSVLRGMEITGATNSSSRAYEGSVR